MLCPQVGFATAVALLSNVLFAYLIGLTTNYINNLNITAALFRDKLAKLRSFMEYRHLSPEIQVRISDLYSGPIWRSTRGADEKSVLSHLPVSMRKNVSLYLYADLLINVPIFQARIMPAITPQSLNTIWLFAQCT